MEEEGTMKFVKGVVVGTAIAASVIMLCNEGTINKRRLMRRGRQIAKKLGTI